MSEVLHGEPGKIRPREHIRMGLNRPVRQPTLKIYPDYSLLTPKPKSYYKPAIHRTVSLYCLLAFTLGLLALIEYSLHVLPHHKPSSSNRPNGVRKRQIPPHILESALTAQTSPQSTRATLTTTASTTSGTQAVKGFSTILADLPSESYINDQVQTLPINTPLPGTSSSVVVTDTLRFTPNVPEPNSSNGLPDSSRTPLYSARPGRFLDTNVLTLSMNGPTRSNLGANIYPTFRPQSFNPDEFLDANVLTLGIDRRQNYPAGLTNTTPESSSTSPPEGRPGSEGDNLSPISPSQEIRYQEILPSEPTAAVNPAAVLQGTGAKGRTSRTLASEASSNFGNRFSITKGPTINVDNESPSPNTDGEGHNGADKDVDSALPSILNFANGETSLFQIIGQNTGLASGHQAVVTPAPTSNAKNINAENLGGASFFTSTISSKEAVFTSSSVAPIGSSGTTTSTVLAGQEKVTVSTTAASTTEPGSSAMPTNIGSFTKSDVPLTLVKSPVNYFYGVYFPVLLAVLYQLLIGCLYTATKMMEPFAMLSRPNSIPAKDFLWINYLSANDEFEPFAAMASGHWLMLWVAILYTAAQLLSPLSSEMLGIYPGYHTTDENMVVDGACKSPRFSSKKTMETPYMLFFTSFNHSSFPSQLISNSGLFLNIGSNPSIALWIHPQIARLMQGILSFTSLLLIGMWFLLRKNQSHIYSDPSSIAGIACLVHHPETVRRFHEMNQTAPKDQILKQFAGSRWHLGWYQAIDNTEHYGIIASNTSKDTPVKSLKEDTDASPHGETAETSLLESAPYLKKLRTQLALNILLLLLTTGLFGVILAYQFNSSNNGFERFMDAESFGPRFLLTCMGILLKSQWTRLERRSVVAEPFAEAHRHTGVSGGASPSSTIHASRTLIPVTTLIISLWRRRFIPALLAFTALLAEALTIVLPGIPSHANREYVASYVSRYVSFGILGFMMLVMVGYWISRVVRWRTSMKLPKDPNTLGAMIMYVAGTQMAQELADLATTSARDTSRQPGHSRRGVLLKKERRENGGVRVVVDFEDGRGGA